MNFVVTGYSLAIPFLRRLNSGSGDDMFLLESFTDGARPHVYVLYGFSWQGTLAGATFSTPTSVAISPSSRTAGISTMAGRLLPASAQTVFQTKVTNTHSWALGETENG